MKLKHFFAILALSMGTFTFVACGDDEEVLPQEQDDNQGQASETYKEVVGTYIGWTHLKTNFIDKNYDKDTLSLAVADKGSLTAIFKNKTWGTATITGIKANKAEADKGYTLLGGTGSFVMNNPRDNSTQEFSCTLDSATISADKTQMTAYITATMDVAGGHGDMHFTFQTGEMPTE